MIPLAAQGRPCGAGAGTVTAVDPGEFAARFTDPIPVERGGEIEHIHTVDDRMGVVHVAFTPPQRPYDDVFVLYSLGEDWKIVSKAFTVEPVEA